MIELLTACGEALYGPQWQSPLARELGVSDRTVRRWVAGTSDMPTGITTDLLRITQARAVALDGLVEQLRSVVA